MATTLQAQAATTVRAAVLLDLENLLYPERQISPDVVRAGFAQILQVVAELADVRHVIACCDGWLAGMVTPVSARAGVRIHPCAIGKDCADNSLLARAADIPASVNALIVGSGDHAFAPLVAAQALAGRHTVVIGRRGGIALALRTAAHRVVELPPREVALAA